MVDNKTLEVVAGLMIKIPSIEIVKTVCLNELHIDATEVDEAIKGARTLLTRAADYNRDEEFGKAITSLNDLYASNIKIKDYKTALATRREISLMLGLKRKPDENMTRGENTAIEIENEIRTYLEPLQLAPQGTPVVELVRILASKIINQ
ncbi:MAG: hypothetical protein LBQ66_00450 [Planctomycetaceae bacterium]|jgi:hypothetical protein|nr:hypothetical protein [Planctomycetaceae bacterium]